MVSCAEGLRGTEDKSAITNAKPRVHETMADMWLVPLPLAKRDTNGQGD